ncbi:asparaginase [Nocardioides daeguensis]|uniref:Asparaginase n=1 Tax=Nocardioides daeguensis TaxID=908359 RepID=A0ABP6V000_9ACTN|nr:asparaginase [Nocardioides daeguensis]MBV6727206.1 asparaginase [Nocardioides daeguensis]MCR1771220.1 asparaginase [Nocardioides daeguensis]
MRALFDPASPGATGASPASGRRRVAVLALGGTIAMTSGGDGLVPVAGARRQLEELGVAWDEIDVLGQDLAQVPSAHLGWGHLRDLADRIGVLARTGGPESLDGVVVTQGTDLLEDVAFGLDLLLDHDLPVVVTGALRGRDAVSSDAGANLANAVVVAADPGARGRGVLVAANETVHAARSVRKTHTHRLEAFTSPSWGPEGLVVEGRVIWRGGPRGPRVGLPRAERGWPRVPVLPTGLGDDGMLLDGLLASPPDGLVVEAVGAGHVPHALVDALASLAQSVPVVLCTRVPSGPVLRATYGYAGSETDLLRRGLLWAGALPAHKARILLVLALAGGLERGAVEHRLSQLAVTA